MFFLQHKHVDSWPGSAHGDGGAGKTASIARFAGLGCKLLKPLFLRGKNVWFSFRKI